MFVMYPENVLSFNTDESLCGGVGVECTTSKYFINVTMGDASSMVFGALLMTILLLSYLLLRATLLGVHQAYFSQRQYSYDESPTPLTPKVYSSATEPLPAIAMASSLKDSATPPLEVPSTLKGQTSQPQTIIHGTVRSLNLTINNNALPQSEQAALISMVEVLQSLRADINKIGRQMRRKLRIRSRQKRAQRPPWPGPGPWASSNFDHYEYGSDSGTDSGWGTDRLWRPDNGWGNQTVQEDGNDEYAGEDGAFETQTAIQEHADCNVVEIDLWRSGTDEGAAADRDNQFNAAPISESRGSCISHQQQQPEAVTTPPNPISRTPTPRLVPSTTLDFTPSPAPSNVFSGVIGADSSLVWSPQTLCEASGARV